MEGERHFETEQSFERAIEPVPLTISVTYDSCRICLEHNSQPPYCKCRGHFKMHAQCLLEYLKGQQDVDGEQPSCEVCTETYRLELQANRKVTCSGIGPRIQTKRSKCICLCVTINVVMAYLVVFGWLMAQMQANAGASIVRVVLVCIAAFSAFVLFITSATWVYEFLLLKKQPVKVIPARVQKPGQKKGRNREEELMESSESAPAGS